MSEAKKDLFAIENNGGLEYLLEASSMKHARKWMNEKFTIRKIGAVEAIALRDQDIEVTKAD